MIQKLNFDQDILSDWAQVPIEVPDPIIANATVLSEQEGAAALKLRRRFMRQGYATVDRNQGDFEKEETGEDQDGGETEPTLEPDAHPPSSSNDPSTSATPPEQGASSSAPARAGDPSSDTDSDSDEMVPDIPDQGFSMSLSLEEKTIGYDQCKQYAAFKFLEKADAVNSEDEADSDSDSGEDDSAAPAAPEPPAWMQAETPAEQIALEKGKRLVEMFDNTPLEDLDPIWFLIVFLDHFPNGTGLPPPGVSIRAWLRYLIKIDGSLFQLAPFLCAAGDWILRHEVNLAAYLQFKVSPGKFARAALAEVEDARRVAEILAKLGQPKPTDSRVVHDLHSSVVAVESRTSGSVLASMKLRRKTFAGWGHFGIYSIFFTINKLETRSPYCWRLAGCDDPLWKYPAPGSTSVPPNKDMAMINLVRAHPVAQNAFFEIGVNTFREVCCGFARDGQYAQDYDANGRPKGFFGPLDAVMLKREQSGRRAHHAHGQMISRLTKPHLILEALRLGSERVIKWMASNACMVMGDHVVSLRPDGVTPARVRPAAVQGKPEEVELVPIKRRPKNWLLRCEMPEVDHLPPEQRKQEMAEYTACLKTALQIHEHSSRCIGPAAGARGDDTDCSLGYKPGPPCEPVGRWDAENQELYLPRDRTKLVSCNEVLMLADRCNHNFVMNGDRSARMANRATETRSFTSLARQNSLYNTKYDTNTDDLSGEQLVFNLAAAQQRTIDEEANDGRKTVARLTNAMHK